MESWKALVNEWTAIVSAHRNDTDRLESQIERLIVRWNGTIEDTGGGMMVGFISLSPDASATVNDESIHLWIDCEPFSDDVGDEFVNIDEVLGS